MSSVSLELGLAGQIYILVGRSFTFCGPDCAYFFNLSVVNFYYVGQILAVHYQFLVELFKLNLYPKV